MAFKSRRDFITETAACGLAASLALSVADKTVPQEKAIVCPNTHIVPLSGPWLFKPDIKDVGESEGWQQTRVGTEGWANVIVPHTWQIYPESANYRGIAWYRREFRTEESWAGMMVRVEFEAIFHSAKVWLNDKLVGEHLRRGYTAFTLDLSEALHPGNVNMLVVRVDNSLHRDALPRGDSYDWTPDGGILRPVSLLVSSRIFIERVDVDAVPDLTTSPVQARIETRVVVRNVTTDRTEINIGWEIIDNETGRVVLRQDTMTRVELKPQSVETFALPSAHLSEARLWHFDHPYLYQMLVGIERDGQLVDSFTTTFGARTIEVRGCRIYLNGEHVRLMGVERMAGGNPGFGMAEPASWIVHGHDDLKKLNTIFTRVHWQQDKRVLDYCDQHGILIQEEVPAWGPSTFDGMIDQPSPEIMQNGLEQLREMIHRDRNHPSVFAWGVCNEINGQNPPASRFVKRLYEEAKKLDSRRLVTYASNSLEKTPEKDVAGKMDFIEWNEYYESWYKGTVEEMKKNLEEIHRAFPDKPIVISEYGYCECRPEWGGGDPKRIKILRDHNKAFREYNYVAGAIFFCYNDYRTHKGDKGIGPLKQRVMGVVDLYGARKPSFDALRQESSPVAELRVRQGGGRYSITIVTRKDLPAYTLDRYRLRVIAFIEGDIPVEQRDVVLPRLVPGEQTTLYLEFTIANPIRIQISLQRPTGYSVFTTNWPA